MRTWGGKTMTQGASDLYLAIALSTTLLEQKVAVTKSRETKSRVELIIAQNSKTKSRGNLMSHKIGKQKVAGTKSREVAQCFEKKIGTKSCGN